MTETAYPVDVQIERPERSSRMWALFTIIPIKSIALIVHIIVSGVLNIAVAAIFFISQIAVLFSGKYPQGMHSFMVKVMRWQTQISAFMYGLRDDYPPFAPSDDSATVSLAVPYPERNSRGWAIMTMFGIKALTLIPQMIVLWVMMIALSFVWVISQLIVLFTGKFPAGMHTFMVGVLRWSTRVNAFYYGLCDQYPPFSLS
jgi:hypothetical protein